MKIIALFFVILSFSFSQETGGIKVVVKDSITKESIPFATIRVVDTKLGTNTDVNGMGLIKSIPVGKQRIQAERVGYNTKSITLDIKKGDLSFITFFLSQEPVLLQTVIRLGEKSKESFSTNISFQTITQDEIKLVPIALENDVFRTLKVLPGFSSTGDVSGQFYVRGGGGDQNLILFDNMIIYNPFHALGIFSIFNGDVIKSSDILTGGFDPEFGGRLSSVINITSKEGNRNKFGGKINFGLLSGQGYLEGPIPGGAFSMSFRKSYFDKILKKFLGYEVPLSFYDLSGKATADISDQGKVSFNIILNSDNILNSDSTVSDYTWNNYSFGVNLQSFYSQFLFNISASYGNYLTTVDPKNKSEKQSGGINNFFLNFKTDYLFGNNDLMSFGFSLLDLKTRLSYVNSSNLSMRKTEFMTEANLWLKYKFTQINNFITEFGCRTNMLNSRDMTYYNLEPRINFKIQFHRNFSIKGSYTRMHQAVIATSNEDDLIPLFEAWVPLTDKMYPERADQYVLGFDNQLFDNINFTIQYYYKKIRNFIGYNLERDTKEDPDFSSGKGISYGLESLFKFNTLNYYGWITYNLNWAEKTLDGITFPPRYDKRHNINIILGTKLPFNIDFSLHWEGSSGMAFTPIVGYYDALNLTGLPYNTNYKENLQSHAIFGNKNSRRLPFYHKLDLNVSRLFLLPDLAKLKVSLDIINVYDQKNIFYYDLKTGKRFNMLPFLPTISVGAEI